MDREFEGVLFSWRGPSPFHFVAVPQDVGTDLQAVAALVRYGWGHGARPRHRRVATWATSLYPKDGGSLLPIRDRVRTAEALAVDDVVRVRLQGAV